MAAIQLSRSTMRNVKKTCSGLSITLLEFLLPRLGSCASLAGGAITGFGFGGYNALRLKRWRYKDIVW